MSEGSEVLLGEIPVSTRLVQGTERLRLVFTSKRIIVDHMGKRGAGAVAGLSILGWLSGAFEDLFKTSREAVKKRTAGKMMPDEVLMTHRDNFSITYDEIVNAMLFRTEFSTRITIITRGDKFEFSSGAKFDTVRGFFRDVLGTRLSIHLL